MGDELMFDAYDKTLSKRALNMATGVEDCCMQIIKSQGTIRESVLLGQEILQMRPAHMSDEAKKLWDAVDKGIIRIFNNAVDMTKGSAKFFGFFSRFQQSFQYYQSNKDKSLMISLQHLHKDVKAFTVFQEDFSKTDKTIKNLEKSVKHNTKQRDRCVKEKSDLDKRIV